MVKNNPGKVNGRRVAIVAGLRTPFLKSGTDYRDLTALDLGSGLTTELLARTGLTGDQIDQIVFGVVVGDVTAPNIAREIVLAAGLPRSIDAYSVSRACATSTQAIEIKIPAGEGIAVYKGDYYYGTPTTWYGASFSDRIYRQDWMAAGHASHWQLEVEFDGSREVDLQEIGMEVETDTT